VEPETLATLTAHLEADPAVVAVAPLLVDADGKPVSRQAGLPAPGDLWRAWKAGRVWTQSLPNEKLMAGGVLQAQSAALECADPRAILVRSQFVRERELLRREVRAVRVGLSCSSRPESRQEDSPSAPGEVLSRR
jgi:hypothetical protein